MTNSINPFAILEQKLHNIEVMLMDIKFSRGTDHEDVYLSIQKAGDFLGKTPNALRVMAHKGQIPYLKKNNKLFFKKSELVDWLESGRIDQEEVKPEDILLPKTKGVKPHG